MILFKTIFKKAIKMFDDPDIESLAKRKPIAFYQLMRPYLINGMNRFSNPTAVSYALSNYTEEEGEIETIEGTGENVYNLESRPLDNSDIEITVDGIIDTSVIYNKEDNTITFSQPVEVGQVINFIWYYAGEYTVDFDGLLSTAIPFRAVQEQVVNILAHCLVIEWGADNVENVYTELMNVLTDTDFKLHSPATSTEKKMAWYESLKNDLFDLMVKLNWNILTTSSRGSTFGKK